MSLADLVVPPPQLPKRQGRVHRMDGDEEIVEQPADAKGNPEPIKQPFLVAGGRGELLPTAESPVRSRAAKKGRAAMPKGVYDRTKSKKRKRGPGFADREHAVKAGRKTKGVIRIRRPHRFPAPLAGEDDVSFLLDEAGRITVVAKETNIKLSLASTKRLAVFMERSKGIRA